MKVLVTGANGYLGTGIARILADNQADVIATDVATDRVDKDIETIETELFSVDDPYTFFGKPDCVLHLAWRDGFVHYSDAHFQDLPLHFQFLKKLVHSEVKKIAVMGSMHEIGFFEGSIDENTPCHPLSYYGISKNALRDAAEVMSKGAAQLQWLRGFYIVGNTEYGSSVFSKIMKASHEGKKEFPFTMGQNQFDFLNYEDFCKQAAMAVMQSDVLGIINICSGRPEKLSDRVERFIKENELRISLNYGAFPDRPYDSKAVWGNNEKIMRILRLFGKEKI